MENIPTADKNIRFSDLASDAFIGVLRKQTRLSRLLSSTTLANIFTKEWPNRTIALQNGCVYIFKSESQTAKPSAAISLYSYNKIIKYENDLPPESKQKPPYKFAFVLKFVQGDAMNLCFATETSENRTQWMTTFAEEMKTANQVGIVSRNGVDFPQPEDDDEMDVDDVYDYIEPKKMNPELSPTSFNGDFIPIPSEDSFTIPIYNPNDDDDAQSDMGSVHLFNNQSPQFKFPGKSTPPLPPVKPPKSPGTPPAAFSGGTAMMPRAPGKMLCEDVPDVVKRSYMQATEPAVNGAGGGAALCLPKPVLPNKPLVLPKPPGQQVLRQISQDTKPVIAKRKNPPTSPLKPVPMAPLKPVPMAPLKPIGIGSKLSGRNHSAGQGAQDEFTKSAYDDMKRLFKDNLFLRAYAVKDKDVHNMLHDGLFYVRESVGVIGQFTLCVYADLKIRKFHLVKKDEHQFHAVSHPDRIFKNMNELLYHYTKNDLPSAQVRGLKLSIPYRDHPNYV